MDSTERIPTTTPQLPSRLLTTAFGLIFLAVEACTTWIAFFPMETMAAPGPQGPPMADVPGVVGWGVAGAIGYFLLGTMSLIKCRGHPLVPTFVYVLTLGVCFALFAFLIPFLFASFNSHGYALGDLIGRLAVGYSIPATAIMAAISLRARMTKTWLGEVAKNKWWAPGIISMVLPLTVITLIAILLIIES